MKHVCISGNQRTSSKLIFWSRETGIHFWKSTYFMKIDICITRIRYTFLEKQRLHQNWYFYNLKHVYISGNQRTSSKLIFLSRGTGIHFWKSTYFIKIDIFITWNRYTILEINVLHENRYLYNLNQVYISGKTTTSSKLIFSQRETGIYFWYQRTSTKLIFLSHETGIHFWKSTYFMQIDICITWIRYTFLEKQRLHQKTYFFKIIILIPWNRYSFLEFNVLHQIRYFYNLKQVYNFGNQRTSWK